MADSADALAKTHHANDSDEGIALTRRNAATRRALAGIPSYVLDSRRQPSSPSESSVCLPISERHTMRRVVHTALLVLISASVLAQEKVDQPSFRSGVELVQLDVAVLDEQRRPVRGLTADEFTVLENGVRRPIRTFSAVDIPARTRAQEPVWAKDAAPRRRDQPDHERGRAARHHSDGSLDSVPGGHGSGPEDRDRRRRPVGAARCRGSHLDERRLRATELSPPTARAW